MKFPFMKSKKNKDTILTVSSTTTSVPITQSCNCRNTPFWLLDPNLTIEYCLNLIDTGKIKIYTDAYSDYITMIRYVITSVDENEILIYSSLFGGSINYSRKQKCCNEYFSWNWKENEFYGWKEIMPDYYHPDPIFEEVIKEEWMLEKYPKL